MIEEKISPVKKRGRGRPKGGVTSRRRIPKEVISKTGIALDTCYCRRCRKNQKPEEFYDAVDNLLDTNGKMSVCKTCINELYNRAYQNEHSLDRTILYLCRRLNVKYDENAITAMKTQLINLEEKKKEYSNLFSLYKQKLAASQRAKIGKEDSTNELIFAEMNYVVENKSLSDSDVEIEFQEYLESFWGKGLSFEDYDYLELELSNWKASTKCDTQSELVLIKEICFKQNEIRQARVLGQPVDGKVRALQEIMKNSALTPSQQNAASSGKMFDTFGVWLKQIEEHSPAEWFADQKKFADMDGLIEYGEKFITRPIKNFITGSRDFGTEEIAEMSELDDGIEEEGV